MNSETASSAGAFVDRAFCDRQFVTFNNRKADVPAGGWKGLLEEKLDAVLPFSGSAWWGALAGLAVAGGPVGLAAVALVTHLARQARQQGLPVVEIGRREATQVRFPPGHPRPGFIYAGHPVVPERYFTLADFHRRTFEHKVGELIGLLAGLGAVRYRVEHLRGFAADLSTGAELEGLSKKVAGAKLRVAGSKRRVDDLRSEWQLPPQRDAPRVPEGLVWYAHEDLWQRVATQRIRHGVRRLELELRYEDDFGVSADVAARFIKVGFNLGGHFEQYEATAWHVSAEFAPLV